MSSQSQADTAVKMDTKDDKQSSSSSTPAVAPVTEEPPKKKRGLPFGGNPGKRGAKGKQGKKKKPNAPPSFHADNFANKTLTNLTKQAKCKRLSQSGKISTINSWLNFLLGLTKLANMFSIKAGRKKTIAFADMVAAADYYPHLKEIKKINKKYVKPKNAKTTKQRATLKESSSKSKSK